MPQGLHDGRELLVHVEVCEGEEEEEEEAVVGGLGGIRAMEVSVEHPPPPPPLFPKARGKLFTGWKTDF